MYTNFLGIIAQFFDTHIHAKKKKSKTPYVFHSSIKLKVYFLILFMDPVIGVGSGNLRQGLFVLYLFDDLIPHKVINFKPFSGILRISVNLPIP